MAIITPQPSFQQCRNLKCSAWMVAAENPRNQFCCSTCERGFFRTHCRVCSAPLPEHHTSRREVCDRRKCRNIFRYHLDVVFSRFYCPKPRSQYVHPKTTPNAIKSSTKSKPFLPHFGARPWRPVTGPAIPEINLRIPLDPIAAAGIERGLKPFREYLNHTASLVQIQRRHPPVDVLGGYKFPNAPAIDLSRIDAISVMPPMWRASARTDLAIPANLSIPEFLRRPIPDNQVSAVARLPRENADAMPGVGARLVA
jgi:hypothetical protein